MSDTRKPLTPGCLAYIAHTSTNESARGRVVVAVRPWLHGDIFQIGEDRFSEPREHDVWWIKPAREGETLPVCCGYRGGNIRFGEAALSIERAVHLVPISGPGLITEADILRERARDLCASPSNHIFPDINELDRAHSRVLAHKVFLYKQIRGLL
jgi:hypothetical protein